MTHIEHLLLTHDCVILPRFGGFVLRVVPAVYQEEEHLFLPAHKEIMFNVTLQHTDGLLSESYMRAYDVSYLKAQLLLEEDIDALQAVLQQEKQVGCGRIGSFSLGSEGQVIFMPGDSAVFNAGTYGLSSFHFPVLLPLETEREELVSLTRKKKSDMLYIPVSRRFIKGVAASVAVVALFLVISTPVKEINQSAYTASFVPTEMMMSHKLEPALSDTPVSVLSEEVVEEAIVEKEEIDAAPAPITKQDQDANKKMFYIVIASLPTGAQADKMLAGVSRTAYKNADKIACDGKYRIYADRFDNRKEAESYLATLRKDEKYKDAWLFISR